MIIYQCDQCSKQGVTLQLKLVKGFGDICPTCIDVLETKRIHSENLNRAQSLSGCMQCKNTGILKPKEDKIVESLGYYDDPCLLGSPAVYCGCAKGTALNPKTKFVINE